MSNVSIFTKVFYFLHSFHVYFCLIISKFFSFIPFLTCLLRHHKIIHLHSLAPLLSEHLRMFLDVYTHNRVEATKRSFCYSLFGAVLIDKLESLRVQ
jgi:hypothetical protein